MLTLRELVRDLDVTLRTGNDGLDTPIRWVHMSELDDPTPWLTGGELLLTTGLGLTDAKAQRAFVARLAKHGVAALGFGAGVVHEGVPKALLSAAEKHGLPLLEVPYSTPFIAVTERAFSRLVNEQYALLQRAIAVQEQLQQIVLSERGLGPLIDALADHIGGAVFAFDGRGALLERQAGIRTVDEELRALLEGEVHERARRSEARGFVPTLPEQSGHALALPVPGGVGTGQGAAPQAWLVAVKEDEPLGEFDRVVLHQAVTVVAVELLRRHVAASTERRLAGDVLHQLVSGVLSQDELTRRLEPFGLTSSIAAIVFDPPSREHAPRNPSAGPEACEAALAAALRDEAIPALVATERGRVCALVPGMPDDELFDIGQRVLDRVIGRLGGLIPAAGVGRAGTVSLARRSYHEARCAMEAELLGAGPGIGDRTARIATYRDLGSFQFLLSLQDSDALRLYCDSLLGPIEHGEGHYGGELMRSLEAFIESNGQWEAAARRLYCHRHTLRYRIRKIEELTGRDLANARDRIEFWLALRGRELAEGDTAATLATAPVGG